MNARSRTRPPGHDIPDPNPDHFAAAQLAIDCEVEQRSVAQSPVLV
jgi:hypothetical protein